VTLLTVCQNVALQVGIDQPSSVASSTERDDQEFLTFANEVGKDIARRGDWGALYTSATLTGTGTAAAIDLPTDVQNLIDGGAVTTSGGAFVRPLTRAEWTMPSVQGTPRYFLKVDDAVLLYPYLAAAATVTVRYQSTKWVTGGAADAAAFTSDSETTRFPEILLEKGLHAYWRRQKGMPYQDQEAEFEATLAQYGVFDDRTRL
jgi:hypothetical protein